MSYYVTYFINREKAFSFAVSSKVIDVTEEIDTSEKINELSIYLSKINNVNRNELVVLSFIKIKE